MSVFKDIPGWWQRLRSVDGIHSAGQLAVDWTKYSVFTAIRGPIALSVIDDVISPELKVAEVSACLSMIGIPPQASIPLSIGLCHIDDYMKAASSNIVGHRAPPPLGTAIANAWDEVISRRGEVLAQSAADGFEKHVSGSDAKFAVREDGIQLEPMSALGLLRAVALRILPGLEVDVITENTHDLTQYTFMDRAGRVLRRALAHTRSDGRLSWESIIRGDGHNGHRL